MDGRRFAGLDAYRGIAALMIVAYHTWMHASPWPGRLFAGTPLDPFFGNLEAGVALFFVLSGFLIFLPFARAAVNAEACPSVRRFLERRAWRILPLYYAAIVAVWLLRFGGTAAEVQDLVEHLTFLHGFSREHIFWTIGPAWSLAVEVLFYLLLAGLGPLTWAACRSIPARRARAAVALAPAALMAALSLWYKWDALHVRHVPLDDWPTWFGLVARMDAFALGMALAVLYSALGERQVPRRAAWGLRAAGLAAAVWAFAARASVPDVNLYFHSLCALGAALLLTPTIFRPAASRWETALEARPLRWLGTISYSVYLWHEPLLVELSRHGLFLHEGAAAFWPNLAYLLVLSVVAGSISYMLLEWPAQHWSRAPRKAKGDAPQPVLAAPAVRAAPVEEE